MADFSRHISHPGGDIASIEAQIPACGVSLPRFPLDPGLISRCNLETLVDFDFLGCYPETSPARIARNIDMNQPFIDRPNRMTHRVL